MVPERYGKDDPEGKYKKGYYKTDDKGNKIMKAIKPEISCIPHSSEKFMSFSIGDIRFIDSFKFMASSLENLAKNLHDKEDKFKYFNFMKKEYPNHYELLCQKGHYPYEWVDDIKKLEYKGLPPRAKFYSALKQELITEKEYEHALKVYEALGCKSFKDYHLTYLKSDVLLLADVFENFRKTCMNYYNLDPANYLTAPGLAWDAMLLKTGVKLELITDIEVLKMYESMKRGGLCFVGSKRHAKANNKYLEGYDETQDSSYIMYWDANNLYGFAMSQYLPYADFKFIDTDAETLEKVLDTSDTNDVGYTTKIDFSYPSSIHDKLKEFAPAPENITPKVEWFSDYQKEVGVKTKAIRYNETTGEYTNLGSSKLIPHLFKHENYVIDYRNLKFLVELGIKIEKVHKIMSFAQKPFLKPYIEFNTEKT